MLFEGKLITHNCGSIYMDVPHFNLLLLEKKLTDSLPVGDSSTLKLTQIFVDIQIVSRSCIKIDGQTGKFK